MIKEHYLSVLFTFDFGALAVVSSCDVCIGVDIDNLTVPAVPEQETSLRVGIHFEVGRVVVVNLLALPGVVAQVGGFRLDLLSLCENVPEVFRLHAIGQIDVGTHLSLVALFANEQDCGKTAVAETLLTVSEGLEEGLALNGCILMGQYFDLSVLLVLSSLKRSILSVIKCRSTQ